jgi:hypothetical protein
MTPNTSELAEQNVASSTWWTPRRTKLAGFCGLLGGIGGFTVVRLPIGSTGLGIETGSVGMLYPIWYVLFAVVLLAANARYGTSYGRGGRYVAAFFGLSLVGFAGSVIVLVMGNTVFGILPTPITFLTGMTYLAMRLLGSLYGISLWRHTSAGRLTAGLFIVSFPALFISGALTQLGFPSVLIGATLYLSFVALGYDLWRAATNPSVRGHEVIG